MTVREFNRKVKELFPIIKIDYEKTYIIYSIRETKNSHYCHCVDRESIFDCHYDVIKEMAIEYTRDYRLAVCNEISYEEDQFS